MKLRLGLLFTAVVLTLMPVMVQANVKLPEAPVTANSQAWYSSDYAYRQQITIENPNEVTLTNYQMQMTVNYGGHIHDLVTNTYEALGTINSVKPFIYDEQRYVAISGWNNDNTSTIKIYSANADWTVNTLIATSPFSCKDIYVYVFSQIPDKVIVCGRYNNTSAFIGYYDFVADEWDYETTTNTIYITEINYRAADERFYFVPVGTSAATWYNKLLKASAADLFTIANWTTISLPTWEGLGGEPRTAIFNDNLFMMRSYGYYWDLYKWDFSSTWTLIEYSYYTDTVKTSILAYVRAANGLLTVTEIYHGTPDYWRVRTSTDGTNFSTFIASIPAIDQINNGEQHCKAEPLTVTWDGNDLILIQNTSDGSSDGYYDIYTDSGDFVERYNGVLTHASNSDYAIYDGDNLIYAGEWYSASAIGNADLKMLTTPSASTVGCNHHCESDFSDLRFTKSDGTTLIDYWIESYTEGVSAVVWVEFGSTNGGAEPIPATPDSINYYMYYGYAAATSASDGDDTFIFFDHFDGSFPGAKWAGDTASGSVAGSVLTVSGNTANADKSIYSTGTLGQATGAWRAKLTAYNVGHVVFFGFQKGSGTPFARFIRYVIVDPANTSRFDSYVSSYDIRNSNWTTGTEKIFDEYLRGGVNFRGFENGVELTASPDTNQVPNDAAMGFSLGHKSTSSVTAIEMDWVLLRNYTLNEPTWGTWGDEESYTVPSVTTSAASSVEETATTLNGEITAEGLDAPTTRGFDYDTDSGAPYASEWTETDTYTVGAYSHALSGLTKGELYYYRAKAENTLGYGYGFEQTFLTKPDEPNTLTLVTTSTQIVVTWVKGTGAGTTMVRYKDGSYPANTGDGTQAYNGAGTTTTLAGLTNTHTYYIRCWSVATEGGLTQYSDAYVQDNDTPVAPYLLNVTGLKVNPSNTAMTITWKIPTGATSSVVRYSTTTFPADPTAGTLAYSGTSFHTKVTGLTPGTTYYISAWASDGATYSATPAQVVTTLHASAVLDGGEPVQPTDPFPFPAFQAPQAPDMSGFQLEPISTILAYFQSAPGGLNMPIANLWETAFIIGLIALGGFLYIKTKNFFIAMIAVIVMTWVGADRELCQWELLYIEAFLAAAVFAVERVFG